MVEELAPEEVAHRLAEGAGKIVLLDVRETVGTGAGGDRAVAPHPDAGDLSADRGAAARGPIVVYCHSGHRSSMVAMYLSNQGLKDIANLSGGIEAWSLKVDPQVPRY